jgi:hypothetical protein
MKLSWSQSRLPRTYAESHSRDLIFKIATCHVLESNTAISRRVTTYAWSVREVMLRYGEIVEQSFI